MGQVSKKAQKDLFGSHITAAKEEALRRYKTNCDPDGALLISINDLSLRCQQCFVEGVEWKESQEE